jgi:hypothetical protein
VARIPEVDVRQILQNYLLNPKFFWICVALLYALGAIAAAFKCYREGWELKNIAQLWLMAGSAISNFLFGILLDK